MRIVSARDKRLREMLTTRALTSVKGFDALEFNKIRAMIAAIRAMTHTNQLVAIPTYKAHELTPSRPGIWALTVTRNYRLTFRVDPIKGEVSDLDYEDYH